MNKKVSFSVVGLIYIVVGIIIAVTKGYLTLTIVKVIASTILAVLLWWLVLLGINLHLP